VLAEVKFFSSSLLQAPALGLGARLADVCPVKANAV